MTKTEKVGERFLIVDVPLAPSAQAELARLAPIDGQPLQFLEAEELSASLDTLLVEEIDEHTVLVFPGEGAQYPARMLRSIASVPATAVAAGRTWVPSSDPVCSAGLILPERFLCLNVRKLVVIDDVISSGGTMEALHRVNSWRFPAAEWIATAWVTQPLRRNRPKGFARVLSACTVRKKSGLKAAVNSLSTLRYESAIAESYAQRHFAVRDRERFLQLIIGEP